MLRRCCPRSASPPDLGASLCVAVALPPGFSVSAFVSVVLLFSPALPSAYPKAAGEGQAPWRRAAGTIPDGCLGASAFPGARGPLRGSERFFLAGSGRRQPACFQAFYVGEGSPPPPAAPAPPTPPPASDTMATKGSGWKAGTCHSETGHVGRRAYSALWLPANQAQCRLSGAEPSVPDSLLGNLPVTPGARFLRVSTYVAE